MLRTCLCSHYRQQFAIDDNQLVKASGFTVCPHCEGVLKAADHFTNADATNLTVAHHAERTPPVRLTTKPTSKTISKNEVADLLDDWIQVNNKSSTATSIHNNHWSWGAACIVAAIILLLQLIYLWLLS